MNIVSRDTVKQVQFNFKSLISLKNGLAKVISELPGSHIPQGFIPGLKRKLNNACWRRCIACILKLGAASWLVINKQLLPVAHYPDVLFKSPAEHLQRDLRPHGWRNRKYMNYIIWY